MIDVRVEIKELTNSQCRSLEMPCILEDRCMTPMKSSTREGARHPVCPRGTDRGRENPCGGLQVQQGENSKET